MSTEVFCKFTLPAWTVAGDKIPAAASTATWEDQTSQMKLECRSPLAMSVGDFASDKV